MTEIKLIDINQVYPTAVAGKPAVNTVIEKVNLTIQGPSINVLMGPSGCGKSTLLRMMGGVRPQGVTTPSAGQVIIDGQEIHDQMDDAVTVFQQYSNRPDLTIRQNVMFPFTLKFWKSRITKEEANQRVDQMLTAVGLADKADLYPTQLSGGQNQRVALARALSLRPKILLMDEPFGALDAVTRREMQALLIDLFNMNPCVIILITHDVREAIAIGDRIIMMGAKPGRIVFDQGLAPAPNMVARALHDENNPALEQQLISYLTA